MALLRPAAGSERCLPSQYRKVCSGTAVEFVGGQFSPCNSTCLWEMTPSLVDEDSPRAMNLCFHLC